MYVRIRTGCLLIGLVPYVHPSRRLAVPPFNRWGLLVLTFTTLLTESVITVTRAPKTKAKPLGDTLCTLNVNSVETLPAKQVSMTVSDILALVLVSVLVPHICP